MIHKECERVWAGVVQFWMGPDGGLLEHNNEFSGSPRKQKIS
jgi:hypothetical protein